MGRIEKGKVLTIEGKEDRNSNKTTARVQSMNAAGTSSLPLTIPWYLRGRMGGLKKGTEVVYVVFDDASGVILSRMDGNWDGTMDEKSLSIASETANIAGDITVHNIKANDISASDISASSVSAAKVVSAGVVLASHTHSGVLPGSDDTGAPNVTGGAS